MITLQKTNGLLYHTSHEYPKDNKIMNFKMKLSFFNLNKLECVLYKRTQRCFPNE